MGKNPEIRFLSQIGTLLHGRATPGLAKLDNEMTPHQIIIDSLTAQAPWLSRAEIGWRIHAVLGIRTHVQRREARMRVLSDHRLDLDDPEVVIGVILDLAVPMFAEPQAHTAPVHRF